VNPDTGLTNAEVDVRRKEHGYNEVAEKKGHPALAFLRKFWGISAWILELIMVLSAVLGKYSDLAVVGTLLVINAVLGFMQERRAAGVVDTLRKRLQVNARVRRDSSWLVIPARDLVPGDIVRVRPGDIIPADLKLLTGAMAIDQSALTKFGIPYGSQWGHRGFTHSLVFALCLASLLTCFHRQLKSKPWAVFKFLASFIASSCICGDGF